MSNAAFNTVTILLPTTRADGSALALTDIASAALTKSDGTATEPLQTWTPASTPPLAATLSFQDDAPDFGDTDTYSCIVTDVEGNASAAGVGSVSVPASVLAAPSAPAVTAVFTAAAP